MAANEGVRTVLDEAHAAARARWPGVAVDADRFAAFALERCDQPDDPEAVAAMRLDQLYLTCACATGDGAALASFERSFGPVIDAALARMSKAAASADDIKQRVRERLFVTDGKAPPRIAEYKGRGDLVGWVRAVAVRTALNFLRVGGREVATDDADELAALLPAAGSDPELATLLDRYRAELGAALADAVAALADKQRMILRYHYAEHLNIEQIGSIFGVHKTTAFRWLEQARAELIGKAREALKAKLRVDDAELLSIVRVVKSHLDVTLSGYFRQGR